MNNYLISLNKGTKRSYLTMVNKCGKSRTMCFKDIKYAKRCQNYVIGYKTAYGHWPSLDLSAQYQTIEFKNEPILNNVEIFEQVYIREIDNDTFEFYCQTNKMNFLLCNYFNTTFEDKKHEIDFSGTEFLCNDGDMYSNITHLNTMYNKI